jgi:hypothetical protein
MGQLIKTADAGLFVGLFVSFATYLSRCPSETTVVSDSVYARSGMRACHPRQRIVREVSGDRRIASNIASVIHPRVTWRLHVYEEV